MTERSAGLSSWTSAERGPRRRAALLLATAPPGGRGDWAQLSEALGAALPNGWIVTVAQRSGPTSIEDAVLTLGADGIDDLVVVPLEPAYADGQTGLMLRDLYRALRYEPLNVAVRTAWYDDAGYVNAVARYLADHESPLADQVRAARLRFVAPCRVNADGRPDARYEHQVHCTAALCATRLGLSADRWTLAFETAPSAARQPGPPAPTDRAVPSSHTVTCHLPFPAEPGGARGAHADTSPPLWLTEPFISSLRSIVLHGPQRAAADTWSLEPLLPMPSRPAPGDGSPAELVMIGASVTSGHGYGREVTQHSSDPEALACAKARTRKALREFLEWTRAETPLRDAFVWNTCQRVELYGWLSTSDDAATRARLIGRIQGALFGVEPPPGLRINVLANRGARHHLLRTACGLNSALPGDRDVVAQLQTACRIAQCAHTAGPRAAALVDEAAALAREVNTMTAWGRFSTGYCAAALARICEVDGVRPDRFRHLVIGGSTTSRAILTTLVDEYAVPHRQLTLVYRDHHGQMRQLRAALGSGRRIRVHAYGEESVLRAIADADFVYFGIDQAEPVLDATALVGLRDHAVRPLTLVDFNTSGSVSGTAHLGPISLWSAKQLDQAVAAQAAVTSSRSGFAAAVAEAEAWILRSLGPEPESCDAVPVADAGPWRVQS